MKNKTVAELLNNPLKEDEDFFYQGSACISKKITTPTPNVNLLAKFFSWGLVNFESKTIHVDEPTTLQKIYSDIADAMDSPDLMWIEQYPMVAITANLFEFNDGWHFYSDESRYNIQMSSWKEGDDIWLGIVPITAESEPITDLKFAWENSTGSYETHEFYSIPEISYEHLSSQGTFSQPIKKIDTISNLLINVERGDTFVPLNKYTGLQDTEGPRMIYVPIQRKERYIDWSKTSK